MDDFVYDELAAVERTHWWFQGRRRILVDVLRHRLPAADRDRQVVDVGCGTGEMLDMMREFGSVTGLDASPIAVGYCQERFGQAVDVRLGRIPDDVPDGAALITAFDVVEHLEDDDKALRGICERLAPGGVFVCTVPAFPFLWSGHDEVHHHYRRYTRRLLRRAPDVLQHAPLPGGRRRAAPAPDPPRGARRLRRRGTRRSGQPAPPRPVRGRTRPAPAGEPPRRRVAAGRVPPPTGARRPGLTAWS